MDRESSSPAPVLLLVHDGELADVRAAASGFDVSILDQQGSVTAEELRGPFDVVIATPQRMLDVHLDPGVARAETRRIVVAEGDSRTLRTRLGRAGIDLLVRRPVHPAALRALLLHALYRGPEKRRSKRVAVGAPVRFRCGWRQRPAILADLSLGGCRLLANHAPDAGTTMTLYISADVANGPAYSLRARVLRCTHPHDATADVHAITAAFDAKNPRVIERVRATVAAHESGPARLAERDADLQDAEAAAEAPTLIEARSPLSESPERRDAPRRPLERRVIALGNQASQVVIGTDISLGGMRIARHPGLSLGEPLQLAIHTGSQRLPIVVRAVVQRDDGEHGLGLRFEAPTPEVRKALERMIESLPVLAPSDRDDDHHTGIVVSEILDRASG